MFRSYCTKTLIDPRAEIINFLSGIGNKIEKRGFLSKQGQSNQLDLLRFKLGLGWNLTGLLDWWLRRRIQKGHTQEAV